MFRKKSFPRAVMNPQDANREFIRGNVELVRLSAAEGRIAAEGALPYPPGVLCVVPGDLGRGGAALFHGAGGRRQYAAGLRRSSVGSTAKRTLTALSGYMAMC